MSNLWVLKLDVTLFLYDLGSMGSSAAREMDESRMNSRIRLVKDEALMIL